MDDLQITVIVKGTAAHNMRLQVIWPRLSEKMIIGV